MVKNIFNLLRPDICNYAASSYAKNAGILLCLLAIGHGALIDGHDLCQSVFRAKARDNQLPESATRRFHST